MAKAKAAKSGKPGRRRSRPEETEEMSDTLPALEDLQMSELKDDTGSTLPLDIKDAADSDDDDIILFNPVSDEPKSEPSAAPVEAKPEAAAPADNKVSVEKKAVVPASLKPKSREFFILDAPNIAMRHGSQKLFSTGGIQIAIEFFRKRGHKVLALMPEYYLDYNYVGGKMRLNKVGFNVQAQKMPDNVSLLISLRDEGLVATTPAQDYDDSYTILYAQKHNAFIISNDKYRDHVQNTPVSSRDSVRQWMKRHLLTYTFIGDEFLPNPNFSLG